MLIFAAHGVSKVQIALMKTEKNMTHLAENFVAKIAPGICRRGRKCVRKCSLSSEIRRRCSLRKSPIYLWCEISNKVAGENHSLVGTCPDEWAILRNLIVAETRTNVFKNWAQSMWMANWCAIIKIRGKTLTWFSAAAVAETFGAEHSTRAELIVILKSPPNALCECSASDNDFIAVWLTIATIATERFTFRP